MKDLATKEKFIELRAKGWSFDKIAAEINFSKPTLIKWSGQLREELNNMKYLNYQSLLEKNAVSNQKRVEFLINELKRVNEAIKKKDYESLSLKDLHALRARLTGDINESITDLKFYTGESISLLDNIGDLGQQPETVPLDI